MRRSRSTSPRLRSGKSVGRRERARLPRRVDGAEEEQPDSGRREAAFDAGVGAALADGVHGAVRRLVDLVAALELRRLEVTEHRSAQVVGPALGDDVDDAAHRLAELRFVAAGLDLDFLHEVERRAGAERAEDDRVGADRAVARCW